MTQYSTIDEIENAFNYKFKQGERWTVYQPIDTEPVLIVVHPYNLPKIVDLKSNIKELEL